uniref:Uncharacterized protein n=1 Tax=uncultured alpha proteobacterium HF0130_06E21 TaxID=710808 RepID=E0XSZ1_9PROT|nr:hypothetical protein [uncultured alpha proteobacterium HF0130_06E21]
MSAFIGVVLSVLRTFDFPTDQFGYSSRHAQPRRPGMVNKSPPFSTARAP